MDDLIRRQAAIDAINALHEKPNAWLDCAVDAVMTLPSAQQWTPCSEGMPKVSDHYLIQYSRHICPDEMAVAYYSVEEAKVDKNYTWEFMPFADCKEVIAWMPLPKPYEEEK